MLTSRYTMDAQNPTARREMNARADLVAAVRLPSGAHQRAAGTEAVTDLLILRRRAADSRPISTDWENSIEVEMTGPRGLENTHINRYWSDHPENILGTQTLDHGLYGAVSVKVLGEPERVGEQLRERLSVITAKARAVGLTYERGLQNEAEPRSAGTLHVGDVIDGFIAAEPGGRFTVVEDGRPIELAVPRTQAAEVRALLELRDQARSLIAAEAADLDDTPELEDQRARLRQHWNDYVTIYGPINRVTQRRTGRQDKDGEDILARVVPPALRTLRKDPYAALLWGLEIYDEIAGTAEPADLLRHRIVVPRQPVRGVETARDGLAVVLDTTGQVDLDAIADLMGSDVSKVVSDLGESIFQVPGTDGVWQTRAEYLSGDVRQKLTAARQANEQDQGRWQRNVDALAAALPADLQAGDLAPRFGAVWISAEDHQQFLRDMIGSNRITVHHVEGVGWTVENADWGIAATEEWGTPRMSAGKIVEHLAKQKPIAIYDPQPEGGRIYNPTESAAAIEKGRLLLERFASWVWEDPARGDRLLTEYNRRFNSLVPRDYSAEGGYLTLPGLAKSFTPHAHQRAAVARMISEPSVGLFHEVGAGKTAEMVMGLSELKRLGLVRKPAVIVPNHMLEQFTREFIQLYPQASILAASSDDLTAARRRQFVGRAAAHDWDAVIMTRSAFERLPLSPEHEEAFRQAEMEKIRDAIAAARAHDPGSRGLKSMEKAITRVEEALKEKRDIPTDSGLNFEDTGIDYLCVDELHGYKNLMTVSEIPDVNIAGSKRASDLYAKVNYLRERNGARVMCGATATPIANSVAEMHVMQRYLNPAGLERAGVASFDEWAATFGEVVTAPEVTVAGGALKVKSRFARFNNLPELRAMFSEFADVKTAEDLDLPRPLVAENSEGKRQANVTLVPPSAELKSFMQEIQQRAEQVSGGMDPAEDNMLKIASDGRKAALDLRLNDLAYGHVPGTKIDVAADALHQVWTENRDRAYLDPATGERSPHTGPLQIVFCDLGTPQDSWNVYDELRDQLVARGMDHHRIRFIHEARNDAEKERLFAACRSGAVDVIVGSTEKMGTGTNIQARALHLLNLDAPWRPADLQQRIGRALRQGNQNEEVMITHVVSEGSFDTFMWQGLARKQNFIEQVMTSRGTARSVEGDVADSVLPSNYTEIMASSSGNPLIFELATAREELTRLHRLERSHADSQRSLRQRKRAAEGERDRLRGLIPELERAVAQTVPTAGDAFQLRPLPSGRIITTREEAAKTLEQSVRLGSEPQEVCQLGGHTVLGRMDRTDRLDQEVIWSIQGYPGERASRLVRYPDRFSFSVGVVLQLENLVARMSKHVVDNKVRLAEVESTIDKSDALIGVPFPHTDSLAAAEQRVHFITSQLEEAAQSDSVPRREGIEPSSLRGSPSADDSTQREDVGLVLAGIIQRQGQDQAAPDNLSTTTPAEPKQEQCRSR